VSVDFAVQRATSALTVPVTALVVTAGGNYAVEVIEGSHRHLVSVTPGVYGGGYVQIRGEIPVGTTVANGTQ
jgi:hypothetical protein